MSDDIKDWLAISVMGATALFTGSMAFMSWLRWNGSLVSEWSFDYSGASAEAMDIEIRLTVRNHMRFALEPWRVDVSGIPVVDTLTDSPPGPKHESWGSTAAPLLGAVEPGSARSWKITVKPDWLALSEEAGSLLPWRRGSMLRISIAIASASNKAWRKRLASSMRISAATIEKNAAKTAQDAASMGTS